MRIVLLILLSFLMSPVFAKKNADQLPVKIEFSYQRETEKFSTAHDSIIDIKHPQWAIISNQKLKKSQIMLLAKLNQSDSKSASMNFLVLEIGKKPMILSNPELIVRYGEKGKIVLKNQHEIIELTVVAAA